MTDSQRAAYNAHRRELYHKQGEDARKRRRERERSRYHSLEGEQKRERNARRAKLERDRYNKLTKEELEMRNARRRERAKQKKLVNGTAGGGGGVHVSSVESGGDKMGYGEGERQVPAAAESGEIGQHPDGMAEDAIADAVSAAAEVAERAIGSMMDDTTVSAVMDPVPDGENRTVEL